VSWWATHWPCTSVIHLASGRMPIVIKRDEIIGAPGGPTRLLLSPTLTATRRSRSPVAALISPWFREYQYIATRVTLLLHLQREGRV
jgi:hypothetical protein